MKYSKLTTTRMKEQLDKISLDFFRLHYKGNLSIDHFKTFHVQMGALIGIEEGKRQILLNVMNTCIDIGVWAERNDLVYKRKVKLKPKKEEPRSYI